MPLKALGLNCTLAPSPKPSSSQKLLDQLLAELKKHGVDTDSVRLGPLVMVERLDEAFGHVAQFAADLPHPSEAGRA